MPSVIKKQLVQLDDVPAPAPRPRPEATSEEAPPVRLLRANGVVHALEVRCNCCGELTVVELEYDA